MGIVTKDADNLVILWDHTKQTFEELWEMSFNTT